jgi:triosephosphate isomerase (TIM)
MKNYCIANWKMNQSINDCKNFENYMNTNFKYNESEMVICPSYLHLSLMTELFSNSKIEIGSQNISEYENGAFTGEISPEMLADLNINWSIVGHSERRQIFKESDKEVNAKLVNLVKNRINPILCIGEMLEDRQSGNTNSILKSQLEKALNLIDFSDINLLIAYEPVWAIGTGVPAELNIIKDTHDEIREMLSQFFSNSKSIPLLYGGSVNPENCNDILNIENVNGFLIGGASLNPQKFLNIYKQMNKIGVESL